jgi:hypothetical protein
MKIIMQNNYKRMLIAGLLCLLMQPSFAEQFVSPTIETSENTISITPVYTVSSPQNGEEMGLGLRLHFDSSKLEFSGLTGLYAPSSLGASSVQDDFDDTDQDSSTDKVIITSWLDFTGQWPSANALPLDLYTVTFTKNSAFSGVTNFRFSASSHDASGTFRADPVDVVLSGGGNDQDPDPNTNPDPDPVDNTVFKSIPTLSELMMILMSLLLAMLAVPTIRKRQGEKK